MNLDYQANWIFWGHPVVGQPVYGLYEPVNDTFFVINRNLEVLQEVAMLYSSRFVLYVCDLTEAIANTPSIIDNTVCANWTLDSRTYFPVTKFPNPTQVFSIAALAPRTMVLNWNFQQDQEYVIAACFWVGEAIPRILDRYSNPNPEFIKRITTLDAMSKVFGAPFPAEHLGTIEKIKEIIYTEFNYSQAKEQIDRLLIPYYG